LEKELSHAATCMVQLVFGVKIWICCGGSYWWMVMDKKSLRLYRPTVHVWMMRCSL